MANYEVPASPYGDEELTGDGSLEFDSDAGDGEDDGWPEQGENAGEAQGDLSAGDEPSIGAVAAAQEETKEGLTDELRRVWGIFASILRGDLPQAFNDASYSRALVPVVLLLGTLGVGLLDAAFSAGFQEFDTTLEPPATKFAYFMGAGCSPIEIIAVCLSFLVIFYARAISLTIAARRGRGRLLWGEALRIQALAILPLIVFTYPTALALVLPIKMVTAVTIILVLFGVPALFLVYELLAYLGLRRNETLRRDPIVQYAFITSLILLFAFIIIAIIVVSLDQVI